MWSPTAQGTCAGWSGVSHQRDSGWLAHFIVATLAAAAPRVTPIDVRHAIAASCPSAAMLTVPRSRRWLVKGHREGRRLAGTASMSHKCLQLLQQSRFTVTTDYLATAEPPPPWMCSSDFSLMGNVVLN